jgi:outer membrane protein TolC
VRDAELELADARVSERLERETLSRTIENSRALIKARTLGVTLAERNYALTEDAYRHGTKDILSLQDASDSLVEAKVSLKKEEYALIAAVLELEYAVGVPFGTLGR